MAILTTLQDDVLKTKKKKMKLSSGPKKKEMKLSNYIELIANEKFASYKIEIHEIQGKRKTKTTFCFHIL